MEEPTNIEDPTNMEDPTNVFSAAADGPVLSSLWTAENLADPVILVCDCCWWVSYSGLSHAPEWS